jgi:ABC-type branched-subunit amino acid transport system substrate-binding protein
MTYPVARSRSALTAVTCAASLACALWLAACTAGGPDANTGSLTGEGGPKNAPPVKVALLVPLSIKGQPGLIANSLKKAAELALFERDNPNVQLIIKDDKGTPEGARAAAEEALKAGATLILGPLFAKSVAAVGPAARKAGVPVVAFSNDRQVAGNGVYLLSFQPAPEVDRVVAYAAQRGKRRYAALISQDIFGKVVEPVFRSAVARAGGTIVALETYPGSANGMLEPLRKIGAAIVAAEAEGAPVDALFLPGGQEHLQALGRLLPQVQINTQQVKVIGTGGMDYPNVGRDAALVGAWYPGPDPRGFSDFAQKYAKSYRQAPPRIASLSYDAVTLAIALAGGPEAQRYTQAALTRPTGFTGIDGPYRLLADGTTDRSLAILEVRSIGATVIDAAPVAPPAPAKVSGSGTSLFNLFNLQQP